MRVSVILFRFKYFGHSYEKEKKVLETFGQSEDKEKSNVQKFIQILTVVFPQNKENFMRKYRYFRNLAEFIIAIKSKTMNVGNFVLRLLKFLWYAPIYILFKRRREAQYKSFVSSGNFSMLLKMAKGSDGFLSKFIFYLINPSIEVHKEIYIPKNYEIMDMKALNKSLEDFKMMPTKPKLHKTLLKSKSMESFSFHKVKKLNLNKENFSFENKPNHLKIRNF